MLLEVIVFSMIFVICPEKLVTLQTGTISWKKQNFREKNSKMRRPPAKIFEKIYFLFYGARSIYYPILVWKQ